MGFMGCTARIILIALCCPRSSEPVSGCDAPAAVALTPETACAGAPRGRGGHISLTIVHPNNEARTPVRDTCVLEAKLGDIMQTEHTTALPVIGMS